MIKEFSNLEKEQTIPQPIDEDSRMVTSLVTILEWKVKGAAGGRSLPDVMIKLGNWSTRPMTKRKTEE